MKCNVTGKAPTLHPIQPRMFDMTHTNFGLSLALVVSLIIMVGANPALAASGMTSDEQKKMAEREGGVYYSAPYDVVFPETIKIDRPAANVPEKCAVWLGVWADGKWDGTRPGGLIVHNVMFVDDTCLAEITHSRGVSSVRDFDPDGRNSPRMYTGLSATIQNDWLVIDRKFGGGNWTVSYIMMPGGNKIRAKAESKKRERVDWAFHKRISPPYKPSN